MVNKDKPFITIHYWDSELDLRVEHVTEATVEKMGKVFEENDIQQIKVITEEYSDGDRVHFMEEDLAGCLNRWGITDKLYK